MNSAVQKTPSDIKYRSIFAIILVTELIFFVLLYFHVIQLDPLPLTLFAVGLAATLIAIFALQFAPHFTRFKFRQSLKSIVQSANLLVLLTIVILGAAVRFRFIDLPITIDEAHTVVDFGDPKSTSLAEVFSDNGTNNNHPLNSLAIFLTAAVLGSSSPVYVRLPNFFTGLILIVCVYFAGSYSLGSRQTGALAALFVAFNREMVRFSILARGYIFITLAFLILVWLAWELYKKPTFIKWIFFYIFAALGMYSNISMAYALVVVSAWLFIVLLRGKRINELWTLFYVGLLTVVTVIILYMPMFIHQGFNIFNNNFTASIPLNQFLSQIDKNFFALTVSLRLGPPQTFYVICVLLCIGIIWEIKQFKRLPILLVLIIVIPLTLLIQRPEYVFPRVYIFIAPLAALYLGIVLSGLVRQNAFLSLLIMGVFVVFIFRMTDVYRSSAYIEPDVANADQAITYLIENQFLKRTDTLVGYSGDNWSIRYDLWQHNYPPEISTITRDPELAKRIFLITPPHRSANDVIDHELAKMRPEIATVNYVAKFGVNTIYEVIRR